MGTRSHLGLSETRVLDGVSGLGVFLWSQPRLGLNSLKVRLPCRIYFCVSILQDYRVHQSHCPWTSPWSLEPLGRCRPPRGLQSAALRPSRPDSHHRTSVTSVGIPNPHRSSPNVKSPEGRRPLYYLDPRCRSDLHPPVPSLTVLRVHGPRRDRSLDGLPE